MDEEDLESECESNDSVDSVSIEEVLEMVLPDDAPNKLHYLCRNDDGEEIYDRSDLMDGGRMQRLVLQFERQNPPPWDPVCTHCDGEGCEECICDVCDRPCRHIGGVNYGCVKHPVV